MKYIFYVFCLYLIIYVFNFDLYWYKVAKRKLLEFSGFKLGVDMCPIANK